MSLPAGFRTVIGIDPGREKCGYAVVNEQLGHEPSLGQHGIVASGDVGDCVAKLAVGLLGRLDVALGNGTGSVDAGDEIRRHCPGIAITLVDEHGTSEAARRLYAQRTRTGWLKLIPEGLISPSGPYDDLVAEIIARNLLLASRRKDS